MITMSACYTVDAQSALVERNKKERTKEGIEHRKGEGLYPCDRKLPQRCEEGVYNCLHDFGRILGNL